MNSLVGEACAGGGNTDGLLPKGSPLQAPANCPQQPLLLAVTSPVTMSESAQRRMSWAGGGWQRGAAKSWIDRASGWKWGG